MPSRSPTPAQEPDALRAIEASVGGRVGVFALDTGDPNKYVAHRADERFAMCSTFKWALAAAVLARVDQGAIALDERVHYGESDLLEYAPATREHVGEGSMSVDALAKVAVTKSDNTAANLLLRKIGGPAGLTQFIRRAGDPVTRLDRDEPTLNENIRGDARDTTSPRAMVGLMRAILCGNVLTPVSRDRLLDWMIACETGNARLRAGLPASWRIGDKTGTGLAGAVNDVAIATPPGRAPILIAAYTSDGAASNESLSAALADVARAVAKHLAPGGDERHAQAR
ncbi:class A beta-lactamase [Pendulispora albinea]|uniref:Beta-lactamase n=1 Tax=Pendulispora albinea TaxID=2741071 RepID=A0ABZ2LV15_9BACT